MYPEQPQSTVAIATRVSAITTPRAARGLTENDIPVIVARTIAIPIPETVTAVAATESILKLMSDGAQADATG